MMKLLALSLLVCASATAQSPPDRSQLAERLSRVRQGMTREQALAITGPADDTLTRLDPELEPTTIVHELLGWGAQSHGAFPSMGSIALDARGRVFAIHGGDGAPLTGMPEAALRAHFAELAAVPGLAGASFDARPLIRAVDALLPLGKDRALAVITEYLRVAPSFTAWDTDGVFFVLRMLFQPPAGQSHPPMLVGAPSPAPADESAFPAFPLVAIDDVPMMLVSGYMLGGLPQPPEQHLPWYRDHGVIRRAPLAPSAHPFAVLDRFLGEARAQPFAASGERTMLMEQILRLIGDAYRPAPIAGDAHFDPSTDPSARWREMTREFDALRARWDRARQAYGARNVSAPAALARTPRQRWEHAHRGLVFEVILERLSASSARTWLHVDRVGPGPAPTQGNIRLLLDALTILDEPIAGHVGSYSVRDVPFASGQRMRVHVDHAGSAIDSPDLVLP